MANLAELALREAVLKTLSDTLRGQLDAVKEEMQTALKSTGASQAAAVLPDGTKVGTLSLSVPRPVARVVDEAAFAAWVAEHAPAETETVVRPAYRKILLARMTSAGAAEVADLDTGEVVPVPGVDVRAGEPTYTARIAKDAAERIDAARRAGDLAHLDLPQLVTGGGRDE